MQKRHSLPEAKQKIYRYCAYQERCHQEVKDKLYELGLSTNDVNEMLSHLITEGFLNEERFARSFAGGKFRLKHWGRIKIVNELQSRGLTANCIKAGLKEIEEPVYEAVLRSLLEKKGASLSGETNEFIKRDKISKFAIQKGYEPELVWRLIKES